MTCMFWARMLSNVYYAKWKIVRNVWQGTRTVAEHANLGTMAIIVRPSARINVKVGVISQEYVWSVKKGTQAKIVKLSFVRSIVWSVMSQELVRSVKRAGREKIVPKKQKLSINVLLISRTAPKAVQRILMSVILVIKGSSGLNVTFNTHATHNNAKPQSLTPSSPWKSKKNRLLTLSLIRTRKLHKLWTQH